MKKSLLLIIICVNCIYCTSQVADTSLLAHSNRWKVKLHRGMLGMAKPELGPYSTTDLEKLDSPVLRKKTKEGSYTAVGYDLGAGWDWDFSKYQTVEKRKAYRMMVVKQTDTTEMLFSIYRMSKEKNLTFLGELMSKNDEGKNLVLGSKTIVSGFVTTEQDSLPWRFLIEDSVATMSRITRCYIITAADSLFSEPFNVPIRHNKFYTEWQNGILVKNRNGDNIAALKFGAPGDLSNPFYVWIRNDIEAAQQDAIASMFALLMSARSTN